MGRITSLILTLLILGQALCDDESPVVTVAQGNVRGQKVTPDNNLTPYYSFLGIPYAKPPVGDLRFKAPVPAEPWSETLEASKEGNVCLQPDSGSTSILGDENCLFLNVYTPQLPGSGPVRPVIVWIHGGGFRTGSGNFAGQGPTFLLNTGIVYVSLNYRLGVMGFLSTEDKAAPGNAGMKDQVLALRWVQENIAAFGGDPAQVTIFGESAGGASVHYHMLSPMSKGLFRAAIADSGSSSSAWAFGEKPKKNAFLLGKALGYNGESTTELVEYLRKSSGQILVNTSGSIINPEDVFRTMRRFHEVPTLEPVVEGEEAFITENPLTLLDEGKFHNLPYITGVNLAEGLLNTAILNQEGRTLQEINENFVDVFRPELRYCKEEPCGEVMVAKLKSFYLGDQPLDDDKMQNFVDMCTDVYFAEGAMHVVQKMAELSSQPVYFYNFIYSGEMSEAEYFPVKVSGPGHGWELGYLFDYGINATNDSEFAHVRSRMVTMWTNFVKTGNPTPEITEEFPAWLPYTSYKTNYLEIGSRLQLKTDYNKERMDFWKDLYNKQEALQ